MQGESNNSEQYESEIDIVAILKTIWLNRRAVIYITSAFVLFGIAVALLSERKYTATSVMVPHVEGKSPAGSLGGIASMVGIDLSSIDNSDVLPPTLYPKVISSSNFKKELMHTPIFFKEYDKELTLFEYYTDYKSSNVSAVIKKYTIGLPGVIVSLFRSSDSESEEDEREFSGNIVSMNIEEQEVAKWLGEILSIDVGSKEGDITLRSTFSDPFAVVEIVSRTQRLLQDYITTYKLEKVVSNLEFIEKRYNEAKVAYEEKQKEYADFADSNIGLSTTSSRTKLKQLEDEVQLQYTVYSELAMQLEQTKIAEKKTTPILTIIDPATVPSKPSHPQRTKMVIVFLFLGVIIAVSVVIFTPMVGREFDNKKLANLFKSSEEEEKREEEESIGSKNIDQSK